jgi:transposase
LKFPLYKRCMRYSDRGGLSAVARARREEIRFQAADMFGGGASPVEVAGKLGVTCKSAWQWHRRWQTGGRNALVSKGPGGSVCRLDDAQLVRLEKELMSGPAAHGWEEDQRWTLARVAIVIKELFGIAYTLRGTCYLLHRLGWSPQVPVHRAVERDEEAIATWAKETWPELKAPPRNAAHGSASTTNPGNR